MKPKTTVDVGRRSPETTVSVSGLPAWNLDRAGNKNGARYEVRFLVEKGKKPTELSRVALVEKPHYSPYWLLFRFYLSAEPTAGQDKALKTE